MQGCSAIKDHPAPNYSPSPAAPYILPPPTIEFVPILPCVQVFKIDDHMGIAISGLTADGRILCRYMRNECLNHW
jgi:hypothetical protein